MKTHRTFRKKTIFGSFLGILTVFVSSYILYTEPSLQQHQYPKITSFPKLPNSARVSKGEVELGRFLFYDPILSNDSTLSCASCHRQEFAFSYAPNYRNAYKRGVVPRQRRNIMPLFNLVWSKTFFWDGRASCLEDQIYFPVRSKDEMKSNWKQVEVKLNNTVFYREKFKRAYGINSIDSIHITKSIASFVKILISYNSKFDKVNRGETQFTKDEADGYALVLNPQKGNCLSCHSIDVNDLKKSRALINNGTFDETLSDTDVGFGSVTKRKKDYGKFKIPVLRNLSYTAPYMHDGRFLNLDFVLEFYDTGIKNSSTLDKRTVTNFHNNSSRLSPTEKRQIISFLLTLDDSTFIHNKDFSNPFGKNTGSQR